MLSATVLRWLDRRIPPSRTLTLSQKSIFIFPTTEGVLFCLLLLVLLLTAINYQNNMIYLLTFFLVSLLHVIIYHSYQNIAGLKFSFKQADPVFAGEVCYFELTLSSARRRSEHLSISMKWPDEAPAIAPQVSEGQAMVEISVPLKTANRGWLRPRRLLVESRYPFGLIRAWSWIDLECEALVYPQPVEGIADRQGGDAKEGEKSHSLPGVDDFKGIRSYAPGDSLKRIDWKKYAKRGDLLIKEFDRVVSDSCYFSLDDYPTKGLESKLSHLCFDVLTAEKSGMQYGLDLKSIVLDPGAGAKHQAHCLEALAQYAGKESLRSGVA